MFGALALKVTAINKAETAGPLSPERAASLMRSVAAHGDKEAFNTLFAYFAPRIKSYLMRIGAAPDLADDLAQEAMLKVWRKARLFDPAKAALSTWIFTIARNLRIDAARRAARPLPDAEDPVLAREAEPVPDASVEIAERDARIREAFAKLPPAQYDVVKMHFIDDAPHSEIAERLNLPLGTVKSRLRLAFDKIRKEIGDLVE
ncbi:MAG: sigma-70 family RNA polymerase sigma factor [Parvularculaceae bacterium]